jgi:hypothetical protein
LLKTFGTIGLLSVLIVAMNGINQIDAKEFINEEFNIKFEYPDEWKSDSLIGKKTTTFGIEYDETIIAILDIDPKPPILNYLILTAYTNMASLDQFEKTIRQKFLTDETVNHDILDINTYVQNDSGIPFVFIETLYTPIMTGSLAQFAATTIERDYLLFHKDNIGYEIMYSLTPDLQSKYADNIHNIMNQIKGNMTN